MTGVAEPLDQLRIALGEVNILAHLTAVAYDSEDWDESDPDIADGIASLLGLIKKSSAAAMAAFHRVHGAVADAQPVPATVATERWDYDKGTAPGEDNDEDLSAQDIAIVQRIRTRCLDARFDACTDEELIRLFQRNKRVLNRSDEDVIAAMTHQK